MNISHNTRNASKLHECYKRTNYINYVKHTLSNKGVDVWNSLETKFNEINSYNIFKKQIKQHFLLYTIDNYHKTCDKTYTSMYSIYICNTLVIHSI
jgi:hypothetical protein